MKNLTKIYIKNAKKAGFTESALPEIIEITVKQWLEQVRDEYTEDPQYPLSQRVLVGTILSDLLHSVGGKPT